MSESNSTLQQIGKRVQEKRKAMGLTQEQFADKYGYPRTTLAKLEAGQRDFKSTELLILAEQLNVSCDYLLGRARAAAADDLTQAAVERYGLLETALERLGGVNARTVQNELPGFIEIDSGTVAARDIISALNALITTSTGFAMLAAFSGAVEAETCANVARATTADPADRNRVKAEEYAELLQFKAWKAFSKAVEKAASLGSEVSNGKHN